MYYEQAIYGSKKDYVRIYFQKIKALSLKLFALFYQLITNRW